MLRPSGKIDVDGHYIDVVSDGSFISAGTQVEVIEVEGNRIVVREVT
jgi:membrane-bound serine protease (ClpP class)